MRFHRRRRKRSMERCDLPDRARVQSINQVLRPRLWTGRKLVYGPVASVRVSFATVSSFTPPFSPLEGSAWALLPTGVRRTYLLWSEGSSVPSSTCCGPRRRKKTKPFSHPTHSLAAAGNFLPRNAAEKCASLIGRNFTVSPATRGRLCREVFRACIDNIISFTVEEHLQWG